MRIDFFVSLLTVMNGKVYRNRTLVCVFALGCVVSHFSSPFLPLECGDAGAALPQWSTHDDLSRAHKTPMKNDHGRLKINCIMLKKNDRTLCPHLL
jgi:hypothetical protein